MIAPYKNDSDERYINYGNYDSFIAAGEKYAV